MVANFVAFSFMSYDADLIVRICGLRVIKGFNFVVLLMVLILCEGVGEGYSMGDLYDD